MYYTKETQDGDRYIHPFVRPSHGNANLASSVLGIMLRSPLGNKIIVVVLYKDNSVNCFFLAQLPRVSILITYMSPSWTIRR